ncbi:Radical SAM superfamily enzyme, MoaA/NifB/PqqE/SkfB family [Sphingomonas laterariae]|uniref:Radical SAM superfamily enzyme, MoaA/NifB/PqqE/SkfB family n=1 Tax=Edaphosphingomonas laterariae TaxID=861865 RepID=A0A239CSX7_9SPHN|nr:radical SAM protein [Sphingomonas laterariae]SNS23210.1 Radical SAM superfamily enzyme, MoaA/NifB/PqqE/SkfB family [Sphingomonas laterariae]
MSDGGALFRAGARVVRQGLAERLYVATRIDYTRPVSIRAFLTERCNYRCLYCDHWRQDHYASEMGLPQWTDVIAGLRAYLGRCTIQFIGGEPLIRRDLYPLFGLCREQGIDWGICSNGFAFRSSVAAMLLDAHPLNIDLSIDSADADVHDRLRGVPGSFGRLRAGLDHLIACRARAGARTLIRIKTTVSRDNFRDLPQLVDLCSGLAGVVVDFSPVRLWREHEIEALYVRRDDDLRDLDEVVEHLVDRKNGGAPIETSVEKLRAIGPHFRGERQFHGYAECRAGLRSLEIRPDGEVRHCWGMPAIGNIVGQSVKALWEGAQRADVLPRTLVCEHAGTGLCATACTSHRTLPQEIRRGLTWLSSRRGVA